MRPRFGYGAVAPVRTLGSNHVRYISSDAALRLTTDAPISYIVEEAAFALDAPFDLILGPDETLQGSIRGIAREFQERTEDYWREWVRYLSIPYDWQDAVIRAAITLKLCSFEETGAIIAAMTTSIPESPASGRNWDYRYCWLRDAYFVVYALNRLGATRTMEDYIRYITNVAALEPDGTLRPVYGVLPETSLDERVVEALPGFRDMGPVRIGNAAWRQVQNDSYGSVVLAAAQMFVDRRLTRMGDLGLFHRLERLGQRAVAVAFEPDAGLWEFRTRKEPHTYSSVMCWAACSRLSMIARVLGERDRALFWREHAERMRGVILDRAWNRQLGSFVAALDGDQVDASLLLLHEIGFVAADDPRFLATVAQIERQLRRGRHLFRYAAPDDFGRPDTSFTICTFWYIDALAATGRMEEAREIFEHMLACRNHVGLLSEDIDPGTSTLWGNFPQTYSMVGLINSAIRLSRPWEEAF
jgi:pentatricopeptide repeat protein